MWCPWDADPERNPWADLKNYCDLGEMSVWAVKQKIVCKTEIKVIIILFGVNLIKKKFGFWSVPDLVGKSDSFKLMNLIFENILVNY